MMSAFAWKGKRRLRAVRLIIRSCAQEGVFFSVPSPLPTAGRPPHRPENEARCVWKNSAVKQPYVRSIPFKIKRFTDAIKKEQRSNRSCASPNMDILIVTPQQRPGLLTD
jgi:hypothetical protein